MKRLLSLTVFTLAFVLAISVPQRPALAQTTQCIASAAAQGTANAITIAALPCALTTNLLILTAAAANTSTTVTLQPLGLPAQNIVRPDGTALQVGDIGGAGYKALLNPTGSVWVMLNPATVEITNLPAISPGVLGYAGTGTGEPISLTTLPTGLTIPSPTISNPTVTGGNFSSPVINNPTITGYTPPPNGMTFGPGALAAGAL